MTEPSERDREMATEWAVRWFGDGFDAADLDSVDINDLVKVITTARAEGRLEAIEKCARLRAACERWEASLEGDGWSREDIRDVARPGMYDIIVALDALRALAEPAAGGEK